MLGRRKRKLSNLLKTKRFQSHLLHSDKNTYFYQYRSWVSCNKGSTEAMLNPNKLPKPFSRLNTIPLVCSGMALLGLSIVLVNPTTNLTDTAYAAETSELNKYSSIAVSMSNKDIGELTGDNIVSTNATAGIVSYINNSIEITTRKINRFYISVQAAENSTSELVGENYGATIDAVANNTRPTNFSNNTWGYAVGDMGIANEELNYYPLLQYNTAATPQYISDSDLKDGKYKLKLVFAAKINADKPADHYKTNAIVSVAADAKQLTLMDIKYMQDMTSDICYYSAEGSTKRLEDTRDQKKYWVAKLKDGNCWMTQNLDFDLTNRVLTPEDSNVAAIWEDGSTLRSGLWTGNIDNSDILNYYDPGEYVYTKPGTATQGCVSLSSQACIDLGWVSTDGKSPSDDASFGIDVVDNVYNAHYKIGNYYTYAVATAGQSAREPKLQKYTDSICPKGWTLPLGGKNTGQYIGLFEAYGWTWTSDSGGVKIGDLTITAGNATYNATSAPFYMLTSGSVNSDEAKLTHLGMGGNYWLSSPFPSGWDDRTAGVMAVTTFRSQHSEAFNVIPSSGSSRFRGFQLRCVAQ